MKFALKKAGATGFALVEGLLIAVVVVAAVGIGAYVIHQKHTANKTLSSSNSAPASAAAQPGTTNSIDQLTQQDAQTEASVDSGSDTQMQQDATSANSAVANVGGAYDENSL